MSTETLDTLSVDRQPAKTASGWGVPLALTIAGLAALLALYWQTSWSMVEIWWRSETFAHGFMILPISLYLIWLKRDDLALLQPRASLTGLAALALAAAGWLAGHLVDVQVVEQLGLVGMIISLTWALLGTQVLRTIMFPLGFLFFMVPIGEFLIPPMMEFTAHFSVRMIQLTGIPVYADGFFISLPSGDWSIVEGCSGVRYIIASVAVGALYAYMFYHNWWRRAAFMLLAIVTPIIANGLRAFMIIMIGHFSGMKLATGVDHLIYGWVFFGLVVMLMFWIGSFWWDREPESEPATALTDAEQQAGARSYWWGLPLVLLLLLAAPVAMQVARSGSAGTTPQIPVPQALGGWTLVDAPLSTWQPDYKGPTATRLASYRRDGAQVDVELFDYRDQSQGAELVNSQNILIRQKHPIWQMRSAGPTQITLNGASTGATQSVLNSRALRLLTWEWYWIDGHVTSNDYIAKALEAMARITDPGRGGFALVLSTPIEEQDKRGHQRLQSFVDAMWPALETSMRDTH